MNFAILGFYFLLAFAAFAQSNEPVIIVKPYRATNPQSIVKLFDGKLSPHEIQGEVLAVYDNYLKLRLNDQNGSENNGKTILLKKFGIMHLTNFLNMVDFRHENEIATERLDANSNHPAIRHGRQSPQAS